MTLTLCAQGQRRSGSRVLTSEERWILKQLNTPDRGPAEQEQNQAEIQKLKAALSQALDKIEALQAQVKAADEAIAALKEERDAATDLLAKAKSERESLERSIAIAERAIAAQQNAMTIYERTIELQSKLNEKHISRIESLETKLDKANARVLKAGVGGFLAGILTGLVKIF